MADTTHLTSGDLSTIWRAADLLDREAEVWKEGWCVAVEGEWTWPDPPTEPLQKDMEVRVMRLETSARMLREMARKLSRKADLPFKIAPEEL